MAAVTPVPDKVHLVRGDDHNLWTAPLGENISGGDYCRIDSNGYIMMGNATTAAELGGSASNVKDIMSGILLDTKKAGETGTIALPGCLLDLGPSVLDGLAQNTPIFVADTDGDMDTVAGTVSRVILRVQLVHGSIPADRLALVV